MTNNKSKLELLKDLPALDRLRFLNTLTPADALSLQYDINFIGRPKQIIPEGDWDTLFASAGRGFGKTFMGAHCVIKWAFDNPGCRIAMIAETSKDLHKVMIGGESGIINQCHPSFKPKYNKGDGGLVFPNGSTVESFNGTEPNQLRGPQFHFAWVDELAKYRYQDEIWDMLTMCLRLGNNPKTIITTTPRPTKLIKKLTSDDSTIIVSGSTFENSANLAPKALAKWKKQYDGTRLGRQELYAEILIDNIYGLFNQDNIEKNRVSTDETKTYDRIVLAIDPSISNNPDSDDSGIAVAGIIGDHGYLLHDGTMQGSPNDWVKEAIRLYYAYNADCIVYESNQGGLMTENMIGNIDRNIRIIGVHAYKNKSSRAEPVSALYEQNRIHHVGHFGKLENEICDWDPTLKQKSPNRLDALVYAFTELFNLTQSGFSIGFL